MCRYFSAQVGCNCFQFSLRPSVASWFCLKCLNVIFDVWKRTTLPVPPGGEGGGGRREGGLKPMRAIKNTFPYLDPTCNGLQRPKAAKTLLPKNESFNAPINVRIQQDCNRELIISILTFYFINLEGLYFPTWNWKNFDISVEPKVEWWNWKFRVWRDAVQIPWCVRNWTLPRLGLEWLSFWKERAWQNRVWLEQNFSHLHIQDIKSAHHKTRKHDGGVWASKWLPFLTNINVQNPHFHNTVLKSKHLKGM